MTRSIPIGIHRWDDPVLRQPAEPITEITWYERELADHMGNVLRGCDSGGLGVAANQVGVATAMFVWRDFNLPDTLHTAVNPRITESSGAWTYNEGCLSLPGVSFMITRPKEVLLVATDLEGDDFEVEADTLLARLFQHELDHLAGRLIIDLVSEEVREKALHRLATI